MLKRRLGVSLTILAVLAISVPAQAVPAQTVITCSSADLNVVIGGAVSGDESGPADASGRAIPAYCIDAPVHAPTRVTGANDWIDNFVQDGSGPYRFQNEDFDYRVYDGPDNSLGSIGRSRHLVLGDKWVDDNEQKYAGGAAIRPNRTFHAENGKLIVEADVSAGKNIYAGNAWPEIVVTTAAEPDVVAPQAPEQNYAYGHFNLSPTFGCRLQDGGTFTCAAFTGTGSLGQTPNTSDRAPCFSLQDDRLWELSFFQGCGNYFPGGIHYGGSPTIDNLGQFFRQCSPSDTYDKCMDRIRVEITRRSMVWYVNGVRYFEDSGWDSLHQIPDAIFTQPVYVYFSDFNTIDSSVHAFRFHWERLAINPHNPDGTFAAPSASEDFLATHGAPPTPVPTATRAPAATRTPLPAATATRVPTSTALPAATATQTPAASLPCEVEVWLNGISQGRKAC
jgi:hypothetical protein